MQCVFGMHNIRQTKESISLDSYIDEIMEPENDTLKKISFFVSRQSLLTEIRRKLSKLSGKTPLHVKISNI
jgi:hypothetical protein